MLSCHFNPPCNAILSPFYTLKLREGYTLGSEDSNSCFPNYLKPDCCFWTSLGNRKIIEEGKANVRLSPTLFSLFKHLRFISVDCDIIDI